MDRLTLLSQLATGDIRIPIGSNHLELHERTPTLDATANHGNCFISYHGMQPIHEQASRQFLTPFESRFDTSTNKGRLVPDTEASTTSNITPLNRDCRNFYPFSSDKVMPEHRIQAPTSNAMTALDTTTISVNHGNKMFVPSGSLLFSRSVSSSLRLTSTDLEVLRKRKRIESEELLLSNPNVPKRRAVASSEFINACRNPKSEQEREEEEWLAMFSQLLAYKKKHDTIKVRKTTADSQLHAWVKDQIRRRSTLREDRKQLLESIGFEFKSRCNRKWMEMYQRLVEYKKKHNTTKVPFSYKEDPKLASWVKRMRQPGRIKQKEQVDLLNKIGFQWRVNKRYDWMEMYQRLVIYKEKNHSVMVPRKCAQDPDLGMWVFIQRMECKNQERRDLLDAIGFVWGESHEAHWGRMYRRLVEYKAKYNTAYVPNDDPDQELERWVRGQRRQCERLDRRKKLDEIGFVWNVNEWFKSELPHTITTARENSCPGEP